VPPMPNMFSLALELVLVFFGLPLLIFSRALPNLPIPYLLLVGLGAFLILRRDPSFDIRRLFSTSGMRENLLSVLLRDAVFLALLGIAAHLRARPPFSLIKHAPGFWALVMLLYPLVSVFPQELLYRAYFFHRYQPLFGSGFPMLLASAVAFGFVHIIFGNWLAMPLSVIGGFLFALTYHHSGSLLLTCLDHAVFGNFIFTIGLGRFFYHGSRIQSLQSLALHHFSPLAALLR
jgi:uncharacterized protein